MEEKKQDKGPLVWTWVENETGNYSSMHCYCGRKRKDPVGQYTGETHDGNSALCNKRLGVSEDGDSFLAISQIISDELDRDQACKKCLKIYDRLQSSSNQLP